MLKPASQRAQSVVDLRLHPIRRTAVALAVAACFSTSVALANPTNPTVVHGTATFATAGNILNITNGHNAIINWGSFSIGLNELTRFIQPSALSAVLNRVIGQDPSAILGALQSNGRVFLINPNGIVFGAGAQIDVAGLVASTLNLSNEDFLANRMRFTDGAMAGSVVNQGSITGGSVYLVGKAVTNEGLITSPNGEVVLAAGNSVELVNPGTPNLRVEIVAPDNEARNLGTIAAEAGRIGIYAGLIKQGGVISADSAVAEGGRIMLKSTKSTVLEAGSLTSARGTSGGEIIALSSMTDGVTQVAGRLDASAIASANPGNGGFIETSAAKVKIADGALITAAASGGGHAGTWLIDPNDFYIAATGGDISGTQLGSDLAAYGGTNVTIVSDNGADELGTGTIFVNDNVAWNSAGSLTLIARNNVDVNNAIANDGTGGVNLYAGWNGVSMVTPTVGFSGAINLNAPITTSGDIHLIAGGDIVQGSSASLTAASLLAVSNNGNVDLANTLSTNAVSTIAGKAIGSFDFRNAGTLTVGTVGAVSGINVDNMPVGGGRDASISVNVVGGGLNVANTIYARGGDGGEGQAGGNAVIALTTSGGNITVGPSYVNAVGGVGGYGYSGSMAGDGGNATVNITAGGDLRVGSTVAYGSIYAGGGAGGGGYNSAAGKGGNVTINLSAAGNLNVGNSSYGGDVYGSAGRGGDGSYGNGGRGGDASVSLSAGNVNVGASGYGTVNVYGGDGGNAAYGGNAGDGGNAMVSVSTAGNLTVANGLDFGSIYAGGGGGGWANSGGVNGGHGGNAEVSVTAAGSVTVRGNGYIGAEGGDGESGAGAGVGGAGGNGTLTVTAGGGITIESGAYVGASGGSGGWSPTGTYGNGGTANVTLTNTSTSSPLVVDGYVYADGGEGTVGGGSSIVLNSAGGVTVGGDVRSYAGYGYAGSGGFAYGGNASVAINNTSAAVPISITGYVNADGGDVGSSLAGTGGNAEVVMNSAGGIANSGWVTAYAGDGENGGHGGAAFIRLTDTSSAGILIDSGEVYASGGRAGYLYYGGTGGNGGAAEVVLTSAGGIAVDSWVEAQGGSGGYAYSGGTQGNGGAASVTLTNTSTSSPLVVDGYVYADGGEGTVGGGSSIVLNSAGGVTVGGDVRSYAGYGYAGSGGFAYGGNASVAINNTSAAVPISITGYVNADGGDVGSSLAGTGGNAEVVMNSAGGIANSGWVSAYAGYGANGGHGGAASIRLTDTSAAGILIDGGEVYASGGGAGYFYYGGTGGNGGAAEVVLTSAGGIAVDSWVEAQGGSGGYAYSGGTHGNGGAAAVTFTNTSTANPILINGNVYVDGGDGATGGNATLAMTSDAGITVDGGVRAYGGYGYGNSATGGQGGTASVVLTNTNAAGSVDVNGWVNAWGGDVGGYSGAPGVGGNALVILSSAGGINVGGDVTASGGYGNSIGQGGAAAVTMLAGGNIQIEGGEGAAWGGGGATGGNAAVNVIAGGAITVRNNGGGGCGGSECSYYGPYDNLLAEAGSGNTTPGVSSVVLASAGNLTLIDGAGIYSDGVVGLGGANILVDNAFAFGGSGASVSATGNVDVLNNGAIIGNPDVFMTVGGVVNMSNGGVISAGEPTTIYLTFPMLESGGYFVNGIEGVVFDGNTGFFAGGAGAILGTNLLVTYEGTGPVLNIPTDQLLVAMGKSIELPEPEKDKDIFSETEDDKKKNAPVCR